MDVPGSDAADADRLSGVYASLALDDPALFEAQRALCSRLGLRPRPELHLTLLYLGEVERALLDPLASALRARFDRWDSLAPRVLGVGGSGEGDLLVDEALAREAIPRVAWWSVEGGEALGALRAALIDACASLGVEARGASELFSPHVTLGSEGPPEDPASIWDRHGILKPPSLEVEASPWPLCPRLAHLTSSRYHPGSLRLLFAWPPVVEPQ